MMNAYRGAWLCLAITAASALSGAPRAMAVDPPTYPIGSGDVLEITIYAGGEEQEKFTTEVSSSGTITTPLLGELSISGLLPSEVSLRLTERLSQGYYVNPGVIVNVKEYAGKVYVIGELRRPGAYNIRDALSVLNACILAGGFSDYAALNRVKVVRFAKGRLQVFKIDLRKVQKGNSPDLLLQPGDRVEVPRRRF